MARAQDRWLNPNVTIYDTDVALDQVPGDLKPGMSATVEIITGEIEDAISVPIQAVDTRESKHICWVAGATGLEMRQVETGEFTDTHVEIKRGLEDGEKVYLAPPEVIPSKIKLIELPGGTVTAESEPKPPSRAAAPEAGISEMPERSAAPEAGISEPEGRGEASSRRESGRQQGRERFDPEKFDMDGFIERFKQASPEERKRMEQFLPRIQQSLPPEKQKELKEKMAPYMSEPSGS